MDEDSEIIVQVERRERAIRRLRDALSECRSADLTTNEILAVVRPSLLGEGGLLIEGFLVERLDPNEASTVLRILHGSLSDDATLTFIARGAPAQIHAICDDAEISRDDVTITAEAHWRRVSITKLQS